jgi:hypothetical protein
MSNKPLQRRPCSAVRRVTPKAVHGPAERQRWVLNGQEGG